MPRLALTDKFLAGAKPAATQVDYFDAKCPGLAFRLSGRAKTWCLFYTSPKDGKRARATLGHYPQTPLAAARTRGVASSQTFADLELLRNDARDNLAHVTAGVLASRA